MIFQMSTGVADIYERVQLIPTFCREQYSFGQQFFCHSQVQELHHLQDHDLVLLVFTQGGIPNQCTNPPRTNFLFEQSEHMDTTTPILVLIPTLHGQFFKKKDTHPPYCYRYQPLVTHL